MALAPISWLPHRSPKHSNTNYNLQCVHLFLVLMIMSLSHNFKITTNINLQMTIYLQKWLTPNILRRVQLTICKYGSCKMFKKYIRKTSGSRKDLQQQLLKVISSLGDTKKVIHLKCQWRLAKMEMLMWKKGWWCQWEENWQSAQTSVSHCFLGGQVKNMSEQ